MDGSRLAALDNVAHTVWVRRQLISIDSGVEAMLLWHGCLLTLSGDTDCLTMFDLISGQPLLTTPAGIYPQDMCLLPGSRLAVCGGGDGLLRIFRLPELWLEQRLPLRGCVQRVACAAGQLYALCTQENDGLCTQLWQIHGTIPTPLASWHGLPGALHADGLGRLWIASSERLCCMHQGRMQEIPGDFGLIRHMDSREGTLLATDPVLDQCVMVERHGVARTVYRGSVFHGVFKR